MTALAQDLEPLLTMQEAALVLGVSYQFVKRRVSDGTLPAYHMGRSVRIAPADLRSFMADRYTGPSQSPARSGPAPTEPPPAPARPRRAPPMTI